MRNENLGWYKDVTDPMAQRNAVRKLEREGIDHYDWQYHGEMPENAVTTKLERQQSIPADYDWAYHKQ